MSSTLGVLGSAHNFTIADWLVVATVPAENFSNNPYLRGLSVVGMAYRGLRCRLITAL